MLKFSWNSSFSIVTKYMDDFEIDNPAGSRHPCEKKQINKKKNEHI